MADNWFEAENIGSFDTPAIIVSPARIQMNIHQALGKVPVNRLRPHVKSGKIAEIYSMMLDAGITRFKTATIAESEMLGIIRAPDILLAYPPTLPKIKRLLGLIEKYPDSRFSCLTDHPETANNISRLFSETGKTASVYIDINTGMNRTGILPEKVPELFAHMQALPGLQVAGLHAYDGHIKDGDLQTRTDRVHGVFDNITRLQKQLEKTAGRPMALIAGGTPTFLIHAAEKDRECSPGTFVFWDKGYDELFPELPFHWSAVVVTRIISIPTATTLCTDLGYKSLASENPQPRVSFLNVPDAIPESHSEEHLIVRVPDASRFKPGDLLYGVPAHVCPTIALYDNVLVMEKQRITGTWDVIARKRKITL